MSWSQPNLCRPAQYPPRLVQRAVYHLDGHLTSPALRMPTAHPNPIVLMDNAADGHFLRRSNRDQVPSHDLLMRWTMD